MTHFAHISTYHAVDFRCSIGTPILAIFNAEVVEVKRDANSSGVRVSNLFSWNSIMLKKLDEEVYVEYVHISKDGIGVSVGDTVDIGQVIEYRNQIISYLS